MPEESPDSREIRGALCFVGAILLLLSAQIHLFDAYRMALTFVGATMVLWLLILCLSPGQIRSHWHRGSLPFAIAITLWSVISFFRADYRNFALADLVRVLTSIGAFLVAALLPSRAKTLFVMTAGLIGIAVCFAPSYVAEIGTQGGLQEGLTTTVFGTHEEFGSLMLLPLSVSLGIALAPEIQAKWRIAASTLALVLGLGLMISLCRSAWLGGLFAVAFAVLSSRRTRTPDPQRSSLPAPRRLSGSILLAATTVIALLVFAGALARTGSLSVLSRRAAAVATALSPESGSNISDRIVRWHGALSMADERPVLGWGLGAYSVLQGQWTHRGPGIGETILNGTTHENLAHNYYVQWLADTGGIGLALHLSLIAATIAAGLNSLSRCSGNERGLQIGCLAAIIAGAIDSLGSPSYNFPGLFALYLSLMGISMSLSLSAIRPETREKLRQSAILLSSIAATAILLYAHTRYRQAGRLREPAGIFRVTNDSNGSVQVGTPVAWTVSYVDGSGREQPTAPGTSWTVHADRFVLQTATTELSSQAGDKTPFHSVLRINTVSTTRPITVEATYRDFYGRVYSGASTVKVRPNGQQIEKGQSKTAR